MTTITRQPMDACPCGKAVEKFTLKNAQGAYVEISSLGGTIMSIHVPDKDGKLGDVTLGYNTTDTIIHGTGYMGKLIGRFGNRIGGAAFELNGKTYTLAKNDGENSLHGGNKGFDVKVWDAKIDGEKLVLSIVSPDGEEGYPGTMHVTVTYTFSDDNALGIHYEAESDQDTIINLTNHVYFNLEGPAAETVCNHRIQILADRFTEVSSAACIPTGNLPLVEGTPFDLRQPRLIAEGLSHTDECEQLQFGHGYDHNFVVAGWDGSFRHIATIFDDKTGRRMETWTDQPGVQFYGGNAISGNTPGKLGKPYVARQGLCLETQHYPDAIHNPDFPTCVLKAGEKYDTRTEYRFFAE